MPKLLTLLCALLIIPLSATAEVVEQPDDRFSLRIVARGLDHPWSLAFLPDGRMLVTERSGFLRIVSTDGTLSPVIPGIPKLQEGGQGGLLDVILDPKFEDNQTIYFSFSEPEGETAGTAVAKARLVDDRLQDVRVIFRQTPKVEGHNHFGSRLAFAPAGTLFITLGERFDEMDEAQNPMNHLGAVVRIHPDGTIPTDNPFVDGKKGKPEIWSYGHRNPQGMAVHPETGKVWVHEHGPRGGDEINILQAGKNYGWPEASYGIHYWLIPIQDEHAEDGFEEPIHHWTPSIAPSGMMFYTGDVFPEWKGNLFVGALVKQHLARLELEGDTVKNEERLIDTLGQRVRDVRQGPDGFIYLLVDAPAPTGKIIRLER